MTDDDPPREITDKVSPLSYTRLCVTCGQRFSTQKEAHVLHHGQRLHERMPDEDDL